MAHVHLPDAPRLVGRRPGDLKTLLPAMLMDSINIVDPDRHPDAVVRPGVEPMRRCKTPLAATALAVLAKEDFAFAGADAPKRGGTTPVPALLPAELLKPGEALLDIRDVQDRRQPFREHAIHPPNSFVGASGREIKRAICVLPQRRTSSTNGNTDRP